MNSLSDSLRALAHRIETSVQHVSTEEATKTAFILPFISALGYDVFNPLEVTPELDADIGLKKGEKIDYAIIRNGEPSILFECKTHSSQLNLSHKSQLYRYFSVTKARLAVLTNGIDYWFFSDLDKPNIMDDRPFLVFNVLDIPDSTILQISKFSKENFDLDSLLSVANELKYLREIKDEILKQWDNPSDEFVKLLASNCIEGRFTPALKEMLTPLVGRALKQVVSDQIRTKLATALRTTAEGPSDQPAVGAKTEDSQLETTEEELEGFHIVKSILRKIVHPSRIVPRDVKSYFGILLDDNNRKPICRLRFNAASKKYISLFDKNRIEQTLEIDSLDQIYDYSEQLIATVKEYDLEK